MPYNTNPNGYYNAPNPVPQPVNNSLWLGNNYSYPQAAPRPQSTNPYMPAQTINNIISVIGPESAEEYRTGPNSKVIMMNSSQPIFYLKCSDDSGFAQTRAFQYYEIPLHQEHKEPTHQEDHMSEAPSLYLTKEEFNDFKREFASFKEMIEDLVTKNG